MPEGSQTFQKSGARGAVTPQKKNDQKQKVDQNIFRTTKCFRSFPFFDQKMSTIFFDQNW